MEIHSTRVNWLVITLTLYSIDLNCSTACCLEHDGWSTGISATFLSRPNRKPLCLCTCKIGKDSSPANVGVDICRNDWHLKSLHRWWYKNYKRPLSTEYRHFISSDVLTVRAKLPGKMLVFSPVMISMKSRRGTVAEWLERSPLIGWVARALTINWPSGTSSHHWLAEWLERSPRVLIIPGSKCSLSSRFFNNSLCLSNGKWVPDSLQSWGRWKAVRKRSVAPPQLHRCRYKLVF